MNENDNFAPITFYGAIEPEGSSTRTEIWSGVSLGCSILYNPAEAIPHELQIAETKQLSPDIPF